MRLTLRGKIVFASIYVVGVGFAGWHLPVGWWL